MKFDIDLFYVNLASHFSVYFDEAVPVPLYVKTYMGFSIHLKKHFQNMYQSKKYFIQKFLWRIQHLLHILFQLPYGF